MVEKTTSEEIVDQFMEHINAKDLDAATALISDNYEYDNVPMGKVFPEEKLFMSTSAQLWNAVRKLNGSHSGKRHQKV